MDAKREQRTPESIAFAAGAKWIDSKSDEVPDANSLADLCDLQPGDDSLEVVTACVPIAEAVEWVIGCRSREAERVRTGSSEPIGEITMDACQRRMKKIAEAFARAR